MTAINSLFYKTEHGAAVGGILMSLIVSLRRAGLTLPKHCQAGAPKGHNQPYLKSACCAHYGPKEAPL